MNTWKLIIFLLCYAWFGLGDVKRYDNSKSYCFQFTWPGPIPYNEFLNNTCYKNGRYGMPCINPLIYDPSGPPNKTELWLLSKTKEINVNSTICELKKGFACIKYSNYYNNAVMYASHYCGRIIEDNTIAITSGCFNYEVDAHIIEVCACQSVPGMEPCNTATKQIASVLILLPSIIILFYHFYNT